jgi:serine/threonine-protein kinase HipA
MTDLLYLLSNGHRVGTLRNNSRGWALAYASEWLADKAAFPLSPHLALREQPYDDVDEDGMVEKFFDNLLPEGDARKRLERHLGVEGGAAFDLLARLGQESAGALTISISPQSAVDDKRYTRLSQPTFLGRVDKMRHEGGSLQGTARTLLAGAQDKMAIRMAPSADIELVGGLLEPVDQAPTTHILKPQPPHSRKLAYAPVNEFFCMRLARNVWSNVPSAHLLFAPGPEDRDPDLTKHDSLEWVYCVERYDRRMEEDGTIRRLHQIDLLQLRNEWASTMAKYENSGGAKLSLMFTLAARYATAPALAINTLLQGRILNFLLGNSDAHWKNHSLLWGNGGWYVAPMYDVVCTVAYPQLDATPAMMIGGCADESAIAASHFKVFHEECLAPQRVKIQMVCSALRSLSTRVQREAQCLYEAIAGRVGEANLAFLRDRVLPVIRERSSRALQIADQLAPAPAIRRVTTKRPA